MLLGVAIAVGVFVIALSGLRHVHALFPTKTETACTTVAAVDDHHVRKGPDFSTIDTDCGSFITEAEVTCTAVPSRTVTLVPSVTYDLVVRGPRLWIFSEPTIVEAQVTTVPTTEPDPETNREDEPVPDDSTTLPASPSPEILRAFDYEQPPFEPRCDAWRTLMTTEGLQLFPAATAELLLRVPAGEVARDPKFPCEGWKCGSE